MTNWVSFEQDGPVGTSITRTFRAPRDLVFEAWTTAALLRQWWGPHTVEVTTCAFDATVGAPYRITMHMDGRDSPMYGTIEEVRPSSALAYSVVLDQHPEEWREFFRPPGTALGEAPLVWHYDISFTGDTETTVTVRATYPVAEDRDTMMAVGASEGWNESFEKLDALLEKGWH